MPLDVAFIREQLPGRQIVWFDTVGSTMTEAAGLPPKTVVLAEEQLAGQGRHGRSWYSERDAGLYVSLVLRLPLSNDHAPALTLALGLAAAEAIARTAGLACDLRWPNDVLLDGKKCAGILVEVQLPVFIAGIGVNVNHSQFPPELAEAATSLYLASGRTHSRERLLLELVRAVDSFTRMLVEGGKEPVLRMFSRASSYVRGRRVIVDGALEGTTDGLNPSGFLRLRRDDGSSRLVLAGGVRPAE
ncbi:MAG: biotin--[acetyl-CoA-carboxylase] ligase [Acidobacteriota bacterium]